MNQIVSETFSAPARKADRHKQRMWEDEPLQIEREGSAIAGLKSCIFILLIVLCLWSGNWLASGALALAFYYFLVLGELRETLPQQPMEFVPAVTRAEQKVAASEVDINWANAWVA